MNTGFTSSATPKGFGQWLVTAPDESGKIRQQGLEYLRGQENVLAYINKQADRVVAQLDFNNNTEAKNRADNFKLKQEHSALVAAGKWRNFETRIKNLGTEADNQQKQRALLFKLAPKAFNLAKGIEDRRRASIDDFAAQIYRDYGLGWEQAQQLIAQHDSVINDSTKLQGFLRDIEARGDVPMDVIERIRRTGGYLPVAMQKLSAQRFGQQLVTRIASRSNEVIALPGYEGLTLNTAKGPAYTQVLNEIISQELKNPETGQNKYNNKIMQLSGLSGPEGTIAKTIGTFERRHAEATIKDAEGDRYEETINVIESFIGPSDKGGEFIGPQGIQRAIFYFAGGENATGERLSQSRARVTDAIVSGLTDGSLNWEQVEGLGKLEITPRGNGGKPKRWGEHFEKEWFAIKQAGTKAEKVADQQMVLANAQERRKGREAYENTLKLVRDGNPQMDTLLKLQQEFKSRGPSHEKARQVITRKIAYANNTASMKAGQEFVIHQSANNVFITDEMIDNLLLDEQTEAEIRSQAAQYNRNLPEHGKEGDGADLKNRIDAELQKTIERKNSWQANASHDDAVDEAYKLASGYYRTGRERNMSRSDAYEYARDMITKDIRDPDGKFRAVDNGDGTESFWISKANTDRKPFPVTTEKMGEELFTSGNATMYTKQYIPVTDISTFSASLNRGKRLPLLQQAVIAQAATRGEVDPIKFIQAQTQLAIDTETREKGSSNIQPIPDWYVKLHTKEIERIPTGLRRYLNDMNPVGPNKAYTKSGYQPPIQEPYYAKIRPLVSTGDPNSISVDGSSIVNSTDKIGFDLTIASIREVLQMLEGGGFMAAGEGQWTAESLREITEASGKGFERNFDPKVQQELLDLTIKLKGRAGFPHLVFDEDDGALIDEVTTSLGEEKISSNYWRSRASCNAKACAQMKEMGLLSYVG